MWVPTLLYFIPSQSFSPSLLSFFWRSPVHPFRAPFPFSSFPTFSSLPPFLLYFIFLNISVFFSPSHLARSPYSSLLPLFYRPLFLLTIFPLLTYLHPYPFPLSPLVFSSSRSSPTPWSFPTHLLYSQFQQFLPYLPSPLSRSLLILPSISVPPFSSLPQFQYFQSLLFQPFKPSLLFPPSISVPLSSPQPQFLFIPSLPTLNFRPSLIYPPHFYFFRSFFSPINLLLMSEDYKIHLWNMTGYLLLPLRRRRGFPKCGSHRYHWVTPVQVWLWFTGACLGVVPIPAYLEKWVMCRDV